MTVGHDREVLQAAAVEHLERACGHVEALLRAAGRKAEVDGELHRRRELAIDALFAMTQFQLSLPEVWKAGGFGTDHTEAVHSWIAEALDSRTGILGGPSSQRVDSGRRSISGSVLGTGYTVTVDEALKEDESVLVLVVGSPNPTPPVGTRVAVAWIEP